MPNWITVAIVSCALMRRDTNLPTVDRQHVADVEAQAFVTAVTPHVRLETVLAVGYVETRFNPTGSQRDRDGGWFGVMQIAAQEQRCWGAPQRVEWFGRHHRRHVRYVRHDDPSRCTPEQLAERTRLLDPAINIQLGARMLNTAWTRAHTGRHSRSLIAGWPGAYYFGSVPTRRRNIRRYMHYAGLVHRAEGIMWHRMEMCRDGQ